MNVDITLVEGRPLDAKPLWDEAGRVHDWRNYVNTPLREAWATFTEAQRELIAANADEIASREEWD